MKGFAKKRVQEVLEKNKTFLQDTKSTELIIIILKGHLYIERELIGMLTETIVDEKVLSGTTFKQKLDLAKSIGIIDENYGSVNKVNSIRNKYAHNMDYIFDEKEFEDLLSTLNKQSKEEFLEDYEYWESVFYDGSIPQFNFKIQTLLNNIWFEMTSCREFAKEAVELKLREKEIEKIAKYMTKE